MSAGHSHKIELVARAARALYEIDDTAVAFELVSDHYYAQAERLLEKFELRVGLEAAARECERGIPPSVLQKLRHDPNAQIDQRSAFECAQRIRALMTSEKR